MKNKGTVENLRRLLSRTEAQGQCLVWTGPFVQNYKVRYGTLMLDEKHWLAHRLMYFLTYGPIPEGKVVMHTCDNGLCIDPSHLKLGTQTENMRDAADKQRFPGQRRTHCPKGHEYSAANTLYWTRKNGRKERRCRTCHLKRSRARWKTHRTPEPRP